MTHLRFLENAAQLAELTSTLVNISVGLSPTPSRENNILEHIKTENSNSKE